MQMIRYLTHPQVVKNPNLPVPQWGLNEVGAGRVAALVARRALSRTTRVVSSDETKALETAGPIAAMLGLDVIVRPETHENDRSATGYLPPEDFEAAADAFFAQPEQSHQGWETAQAAQTRILTAFNDVLSETTTGDTLFVGHGGVGALLYCALSNIPIDRKHDQPGSTGGYFFTCSADTLTPLHHWRPMEELP